MLFCFVLFFFCFCFAFFFGGGGGGGGGGGVVAEHQYTTTECRETPGVEEAGCKIHSGAQTVSQTSG